MTKTSLGRAAALLLGLALSISVATPSRAQDLRIGFKAAVDNSDPAQLYSPNRNVHLLVYEPLIGQDEHMRLTPGLATAWRSLDPTTWEITLRPGVKFQDGSPFTADDVIATLKRIQVSEGIRTYRPYVRAISTIEAKDPLTLIIHTKEPAALLPVALSAFGIVSAHATQGATEADFNGGRAAIGTGPYRWIRLTPGADVQLARNTGYWGGKVDWDHVVYRFVPNDSARVAALLAGDLDVIDTVPANLFDRLSTSDRTQLVTTTSTFTLYFQLDQWRDVTPFATGPDGQKLPANPFRDLRVRQAVNLALNRVAISDAAMEKGGVPAGQFMAEGFDGYDSTLPPPKPDPAKARALLAEAGYPKGFGLTIHCTNDRYAGDAKVCQTIAQMLSAIGIRTQVEALPAAVFFRRGGNDATPSEFSAQMSIYSNIGGISSENMNALVHTVDPVAGFGAANRGRYASPALDAALAAIETTFDDTKRDALVRQATEMAINDQAVIPVFAMKASWGLKKSLTIKARGDQYTYATDIHPAP